ncbi:MAG: ATP-binding protein [Candidatus Methanomethylophilaceae archaeon]|nr:ATP-binding protein [Candidatus Methanomethylophilaceae archaeon]
MAKEIIRKSYIERLEEFKDRPDLVKIVTGVRRSGKSTLLAQFRQRLENKGENVVSIDLEEKRFSVTTKRELNSYVTELMTTPKDYILLDEVQYIAGWEDVVNTLRSNGANVYVTGSNAKVLSSEFSTIIAGRYAEIHVLPFSFSEFLERYPPKGDTRVEQRFDQYLVQGGMPIIDLDDFPRKNRTIMEGVYDSIVNRDVVSRSRMDPSTVRRMTDFMYSNVGNITTLESLASGSGIGDNRTVDRYLDALTDSFVFYKVNTFDLIGKKMMKVKAKYYASDTGLRNTALGHIDDNASGLLENIVFLELVRRGYDVVVGSYRDYEVDFTARSFGKTEYYQVAKTLADDSTIEREERPLKLLGDAGIKTVLTLDRDLPESRDGIRYLNIIDFLLKER